MKDIGWIILGGGVLYVLYDMGFFGGTTSTTPTTTTSTSPQANTSTSVSTSTTTATTTNPLPTLNQVVALMQQYNQDPTKNSYSQFVYSYYYNMLSPSNPVPANLPDLMALGNNALPISQWWQAMSKDIPGLSGLGAIAHHVNPYTQGPRGGVSQVYGANLAPTGPETMIVVRSNG